MTSEDFSQMEKLIEKVLTRVLRAEFRPQAAAADSKENVSPGAIIVKLTKETERMTDLINRQNINYMSLAGRSTQTFCKYNPATASGERTNQS